jgi:hypothetical protein
LVSVIGLIGLGGCPSTPRTDAGGGGIDANIPRNDAFVMGCATMGPENTAAACTDGCDNDGNGFADCNDFDCCGATSCGADTACGRMPDAGPRADAFVMACATMGPENTAGACTDGCDNDGNGFADCNDFSCCSATTCGADTACGRRPDSGPRPDAAVMACATMGPENTAAACGDGCDNDGNGFYDCGDFDCCDVVSCGPTTPCARRPDSGPRPDAAVMACATMGPENTEAACGDGCDNDGDGFVDCRDFECGRDAPAGRTYCIENTRALCTDMMDNDSDRFEDCQDRDCCGVLMTSDCAAGTYVGDNRCM